jgi:predicted nucleotidyltransferase component of viral defense system
MSPNIEFLKRCSIETGYRADILEKVIRLGQFADEISKHPFLGPALALKGGTALNLCTDVPRRLSVDLDYNYIAHPEREKMLKDRPVVEKALADMAARQGYQIQKSADAFAGRKAYLRYQSMMGPSDRIEVDINFLHRVPIDEIERRSLWQPGGLTRPIVNVVSLSELVLGKLNAFFERAAPRDAWDIVHLPERSAALLGTPQFRARFIALSASFEQPLYTYTYARLKGLLSDQFVLAQLTPVLPEQTTIEAGDLAEKSWSQVRSLMSPLQPHEREYIDAIQRGELRLDLLFRNDEKEIILLGKHPAILWKLDNVRRHHLDHEIG